MKEIMRQREGRQRVERGGRPRKRWKEYVKEIKGDKKGSIKEH